MKARRMVKLMKMGMAWQQRTVEQRGKRGPAMEKTNNGEREDGETERRKSFQTDRGEERE